MTANFRHIPWPVDAPERPAQHRRTDNDEDLAGVLPADATEPDTETR
ncbi:hypothetical protein OG215_36665 (plasmid) [Streptomyces globisporus]|nr:hypothetical protein OG215_36665 [Streptomyces globisporus]